MKYPDVPTGITADALIVRKGKVLLGKRETDPDRGGWSLIGGFVEPGETLEEALRREAKEEARIELKKCNYLFSIIEKWGERRQILTAIFICEIDQEPSRTSEMGEFKWVDKKVILSTSGLTFNAAKVFRKYLTSPI